MALRIRKAWGSHWHHDAMIAITGSESRPVSAYNASRKNNDMAAPYLKFTRVEPYNLRPCFLICFRSECNIQGERCLLWMESAWGYALATSVY